ncbi:tetratricopeptide repeat protein [bacterium]|nr:tetratricopeptide repeat protein [bacterium]
MNVPQLTDQETMQHHHRQTAVRYLEWAVELVQQHRFDLLVLDKERDAILEAFSLAYAMREHTLLLDGLWAFADYLEARGEYATAVHLLTQAQEIVQQTNDKVGQCRVLAMLGMVGIRTSNYAQAISYYEEGLALIQDQEDQHALFASLFHRGIGTVMYSAHTEWERAEAHLDAGLLWARRCNELHVLAGALVNRATLVALRHGNAADAHALLSEGLTLFQQVKDSRNVGLALTNLGSLAYEQGDLATAQTHCQDGLRYTKEAGDLEKTARLLGNLGVIACMHGQLEEAEEYLYEGLLLARRMDHRELQSTMHMNFGMVESTKQNWAQAEECYTEALSMAESINLLDLTGYLYIELGKIAVQQDNLTRAEAYLDRGLSIARQTGHVWDLCAGLIQRGEMLLTGGRLPEAVVAYTEGLELAEKIGAKEMTGSAYFGLAQLDHIQGDLTTANQHGQLALEIWQSTGHAEAKKVADWLASLP